MKLFFFIVGMLLLLSNVKSQELIGDPIPAASTSDRAGSSVSISKDGNTIAIGSPENDDMGTASGHVRVYTLDGQTWIQKGLDLKGLVSNSKLGWSIDLSVNGNTIAIGTPYGNTDKGLVQVFDWVMNEWVQRGDDIVGVSPEDNSIGISVDMSENGNILAFGAPDNGASNFRGRVKVYEWDGNNWNQLGGNLDGTGFGSDYGQSISLNDSGDHIIIGAPSRAEGKVEVFQWSGTSWIQKGADLNGVDSGEQYGFSVDINSTGDKIIIGAPGNNGNLGRVEVNFWNGQSWEILGTEIIGNEANGDFGSSVIMDIDGDNISIGAPSTNIGGSVYSYQWSFGEWKPRGIIVLAEDQFDDYGHTLDLNSNGEYLIVGAPLASLNTGKAYVYGPCWNSNIEINITACVEFEAPDGNIYDVSGEYDFTTSMGNGCIDSIQLNLTINNIDSTFLFESACQLLEIPEWGEVFTVSGIYERSFLNHVGCDSLVFLNADITQFNLNLEIDDNAIISSDNLGATFQWLDCGNGFMELIGESNSSLIPTENGSFALEMFINNCVDTTECINYTLSSVDDKDEFQRINVYPNPNSGLFRLDIPNHYLSKNSELKIYDFKGSEIYNNRELKRSMDINLGDFPKGIYVVHILGSEWNWVTKFVLVR